mmetsp:Transcript_7282/g.17873  ORF Transcript_7282/g.17873 Transcript_7282/m.17873 type:complete len:249 (-) Transcript_7282:880-1626(-)
MATRTFATPLVGEPLARLASFCASLSECFSLAQSPWITCGVSVACPRTLLLLLFASDTSRETCEGDFWRWVDRRNADKFHFVKILYAQVSGEIAPLEPRSHIETGELSVNLAFWIDIFPHIQLLHRKSNRLWLRPCAVSVPLILVPPCRICLGERVCLLYQPFAKGSYLLIADHILRGHLLVKGVRWKLILLLEHSRIVYTGCVTAWAEGGSSRRKTRLRNKALCFGSKGRSFRSLSFRRLPATLVVR